MHVLILAYSEVNAFVYAWRFENIRKAIFKAFASPLKLFKSANSACKSCKQPGRSLRFHREAGTPCSFYPQFEMMAILVSSKTCLETQNYIFLSNFVNSIFQLCFVGFIILFVGVQKQVRSVTMPCCS